MLAFDIRWSSSVLTSSDNDFTKLFLREVFGIVYRTLEELSGEAKNGIELNKFMGDSMLMFFHNPDSGPRQAVDAALGIRKSFADFVGSQRDRGYSHLGMKFAISKGEVILGHFGCPAPKLSFKVSFDSRRNSSYLADYTGIGKDLNRTFRILQQAKKGQILVNEDIWKQINMKYDTALLDKVYLRDDFTETQLFWVQGKKSGGDGSCAECVHFAICRRAFERGQKVQEWGPIMRCVYQEHCPDCQQLSSGQCSTVDARYAGQNIQECCDWCCHYSSCSFNWLKAKNHPGKFQTTKVGMKLCDYYRKKEE